MPRANMDVILLERVDNLGNMGDVVKVRPGYARNFLLPKQKALRATKENKAYYEAQKDALVKRNEEGKTLAQKEAKKLEGVMVTLIRHASDAGQLYGSVNARDIADELSNEGAPDIARSQILLNQSIKDVGLFKIPVALHPEVKIEITVNVARNEEEAKIQKDTGKSVTALAAGSEAREKEEVAEEKTEEFFEEEVIKAEKEAIAEEESTEGVAEVTAEAKEA